MTITIYKDHGRRSTQGQWVVLVREGLIVTCLGCLTRAEARKVAANRRKQTTRRTA